MMHLPNILPKKAPRGINPTMAPKPKPFGVLILYMSSRVR